MGKQRAPLKSNARHCAVFVTAWLPEPGTWTATAGIARRQKILLDGLRATGMSLHVLFILSPTQFDGSSESAARITTSIRSQWGDDIQVTVSRWSDGRKNSIWATYIAPALSFRYQRDYVRFTSPDVIDAMKLVLSGNPVVALCQGLRCVFPILQVPNSTTPFLFDMDDIEHVSFARRILEPPVWKSKYLQYLQIPALAWAEFVALRRSKVTFVCSRLDQSKLNKLFCTKKAYVLPNAVESRDVRQPSKAFRFLILGHYSFAPNRVGADHFVSRVWPAVVAAHPEAQLVVAGADPHLLSCYSDSLLGVTFPGYVTDLELLYSETRVVICPILSGGGTRLKIMEAAAYGRPIVSTSIGAEGIELKNGEEIVIADSPSAMAEACIRLISDDCLVLSLGSTAKAAIEKLYSRERIVARLGALLSSVMIP